MDSKTKIRFSFRIFVGGERYMGPGRVQLMEGIIKHGSIAKAAQDMNMSYRKAWQMVKDMNAMSKKPLVEKQLGGRSGGGAFVTDAGKEIMRQYYSIEKQAASFFEKASDKLKV